MINAAHGPRVTLVGGGIAALAAAVYLVRDGYAAGSRVRILEEEALGARRIDERFEAHFFATHFWVMWRSMFGFESWHSAIVTLGSMTADSTIGTMDSPPPPVRRRSGAWALWERLAVRDAAFGRPAAFCDDVERTRWVTFTVTHPHDRFAHRMERFSGSPAGQGGLVTLEDSSWGITFHLFHPPAYAGQPPGTQVWWGYSLFADSAGDFVATTMPDCTGAEILIEVLSHLGWREELPALLEGARCIPCLLPHATSQFMPGAHGDRPPVVPPGTVNLAFVGQYVEIPDNVVFTVEYSIHSAALAVATLLGAPQRVPAAYRGLDHPNALIGAIKRMLE